jgi:hypothetical protein
VLIRLTAERARTNTGGKMPGVAAAAGDIDDRSGRVSRALGVDGFVKVEVG